MAYLTSPPMDPLIASFGRYLAEERMLGARTRLRYLDAVRQFVSFLCAAGALTQTAGRELLVAYLRKAARGGAASAEAASSRGAWNNHLSALRAFYDYLVKEEMMSSNPARLIPRMKTIPRERVPLSFEEMLRLVDTVRREAPDRYRTRNVAILEVLFHSAVRVTELVSLNLDQVDFENRVFLGVRVKGGKHLAVAFNDVVAEALEVYLEDRELLVPDRPEPALFLSDRRKRLSVRAVQEMTAHYAALAGISRTVSPHLLRHSSVTELVELGTPLRVVQEMVGHSSVTTTERYAHVNGSQRRRAIDALGKRWKDEEARIRAIRLTGGKGA